MAPTNANLTVFPEHENPTVDFVLVDDEPLHVQRWRSETVRLVCVNFPPHTSSLWHQHLNYGIYVVMAPLDVAEQSYGNAAKPLIKNKGEVFCRDHTKDHLLHVITTADQPLFIVEVELLKEKENVKPHDNVPIRSGKGVELLNDEPECRVYRLTLDENVRELDLALPTESVLVVLDDCELKVTTASSSGQKTELVHQLKVGDDVVLQEGECQLELSGVEASKAQFVLSEVY